MLPSKKISTLIVHHSFVVRLGLKTLLQTSNEFAVVGETGDAIVALEIVRTRLPDVLATSLTLERGDGIFLLKSCRKMLPRLRSIVITARTDALSIQRAFKAGARGCAAVDDNGQQILRALRDVHEGQLYASTAVSRALLAMLAKGGAITTRDRCGTLTDRELQVFRLIGGGVGTSGVARELHLSVKTVETYRQRIKQKLRLANGCDLTKRASEWLLARGQCRM